MLSEITPDASAEDPAVPAEDKEDKGSAFWREIRGLLWVLLAVLAFHTFIAKPFYIPSESMMPGLLTGDRRPKIPLARIAAATRAEHPMPIAVDLKEQIEAQVDET